MSDWNPRLVMAYQCRVSTYPAAVVAWFIGHAEFRFGVSLGAGFVAVSGQVTSFAAVVAWFRTGVKSRLGISFGAGLLAVSGHVTSLWNGGSEMRSG